MGGNNVQVNFGANIAGLVAGVEGVKEQLEGLSAFTDGLASTFTGVGEAFAAAFAIEKLEAFTDKIVETGVDLERMEVQLGASAEQINILKFAAEGSDTQLSMLVRSMTQFSRIAEEAAKGTGDASQAFKTMGIDVADQIAKGRSLNDIWQETIAKLSTYKDGLDKTALESIVLGGRSGQLALAIRELGGSYDEIKEAVERSGATLEGFDEAAADTKKKMIELEMANTGIAENLFTIFKPAIDTTVKGMSDLAESFHNSITDGGAVAYIMGTIETAVNGLISAIILLITLFENMWSAGKMAFHDLAEAAINSYQAIKDAAHGNFAQALEDLKKTNIEAKKNWNDTLEEIYKSHVSTYQRLKALWADNPADPKKKNDTGSKEDAPHIAGTAGLQTEMEKWQQALTEMLLQKQLFGAEAERLELEYWQHILATANAGAKQRGEIEQKIYSLEKSLHQQSVRDTDAYLKQEQKSYENFFGSFNSGITSMITKTGTWQQAAQSAFTRVIEFGLKKIEQLVAKWIVGETTKQQASAASAVAITAQQTTAAAAQSAAMKVSATGVITTDAAETFGGIFAFLSPYMGPAAAGPAAAGQASVLAQLGSVASFDVGSWNVPHDMLAVVHEGEEIRTQSESMYGTGKGGSPMSVHFHGGINDAASIRALFLREGPTLKASLEKQGMLSHKGRKS